MKARRRLYNFVSKEKEVSHHAELNCIMTEIGLVQRGKGKGCSDLWSTTKHYNTFEFRVKN